MTLPQWTPGPGYTPISLKVIQDEFGCSIFAPPPPPSIYPTVTSLTPSSTIIIDEDSYRYLTYTVNFVNRNQRRVYWSAYYGSATLTDFEALPSGEITADTANFTVIIAVDSVVEGNETFAIQFKLDPTGPAFYTSSPYTIIDSIPATPTPSPGSSIPPIPSPSPAALIPTTYTLTLNGPLEVAYNKGANLFLSGAPNDTVVFKYVKPNIENLYFDYNPDVAQAYAIDNQGLTKQEYAERHYQTYGRNELRTSPNDLQAISEPPNGAVSLTSVGTKTFDLFSGKAVLGRTTPYTYQFYGSKTSNVINFSLKVQVFYRLGVYGPNQIQSGERAYLQVFGYPTDTVTYLGSSNGTFSLNSQGYSNIDITGGSVLLSGNYNWSFSGNSTPNTQYHSLKVSSYTLSVIGSPVLNVGDADTIPIVVTITGAPNEVITYTGFLFGTITLDLNGRITADINQTDMVSSGSFSISFTGNRSTNTAVYNFSIQKYSEAVLPGPSPYRHRIGNPLTISLAGGVPNTGVTVSFVGPNGSSGIDRYQLNSNGVFSIENQQFVNAGVYTYTVDFSGTGNRRVHLIEVITSQLRAVQTNYTVPGTNSYDSTQPIIVDIEGAPNEIVAISQPTWPSLVSIYGETDTYRNFLKTNGYLRGYVEQQYVEGSSISTWANYPIDNGFPPRYVFLDASGKAKINLNGDEAINIAVQASDFSWTRNQEETFISILGKKIDYNYSRGHTLAILSNVDLSIDSIGTFDTFDGGALVSGTPIEFSGLETALTNAASGKIIVLTSFEAIRISSNMRSILNTQYGGSLTDEWMSDRLALAQASHVFIGIKNGGVPAIEEIKRFGPSGAKFFVPGINSNQNGYPHLMKYNVDAYEGTGTKFFYDRQNDRWNLTSINPADPNLLKLNSQRQMYQQVPYSFSMIGNKSVGEVNFAVEVQKLDFVKSKVISDNDLSGLDTNIKDVFLITPLIPTYKFDKSSYITFEGSKLDFTLFTTNIANNTSLWYRLDPIVGVLQTGFDTSGVFVVNKNIGTFSITYGTREGRNGNIQARLVISSTKGGPGVIQGPIVHIFDPVGPNSIGTV